ncbi:MAG: hypothetical protein KF773_12575 [Deltaproteobacteria bacterium]|nr:hypothetical protein [Deltaproteobacteria bacterium]
MRWSMLGLVTAACGAPTRATPPRAEAPLVAPPITLRDPAIPEAPPRTTPRAESLSEGVPWRPMILHDGMRSLRRSLDPPSIAESDFWDACVRDFVAMYAEPARGALTALVMRYATSCDARGRVVLEHPLADDGSAPQARFDIALVGTMSARRVELALRLKLCDPLDIDRAALGADGAAWTSNRLEVERDDRGCAVAEIPLARTLGRALRAVSEGGDAWVRFESGRRTETVKVSDEQKRDLATALDAYDAVSP